MKKLTTITILMCLVTMLNAQVHFDLKAGYSVGSSNQSNTEIINSKYPLDEFQFCLRQVEPQFYGGFKVNVELGAPFFLESGVMYTQRTSVYQAKFTYAVPPEPKTPEMQMSVKEDLLLFPLDIGVSVGAFDITSGLRLNKIISSKNELTHLKGYEDNKNSLSWGWQAGVRYVFHRMMIGVEYQGETQRDCKGKSVNEESLELRCVPGRAVFSIQYRF